MNIVLLVCGLILGSVDFLFFSYLQSNCMHAESCPTLCDPMVYSLPGSSVYGFLQAGILEWVAVSFSRGSSWPRNWTQISCTGRRILEHGSIWEALKVIIDSKNSGPVIVSKPRWQKVMVIIIFFVRKGWGCIRFINIEVGIRLHTLQSSLPPRRELV